MTAITTDRSTVWQLLGEGYELEDLEILLDITADTLDELAVGYLYT